MSRQPRLTTRPRWRLTSVSQAPFTLDIISRQQMISTSTSTVIFRYYPFTSLSIRLSMSDDTSRALQTVSPLRNRKGAACPQVVLPRYICRVLVRQEQSDRRPRSDSVHLPPVCFTIQHSGLKLRAYFFEPGRIWVEAAHSPRSGAGADCRVVTGSTEALRIRSNLIPTMPPAGFRQSFLRMPIARQVIQGAVGAHGRVYGGRLLRVHIPVRRR